MDDDEIDLRVALFQNARVPVWSPRVVHRRSIQHRADPYVWIDGFHRARERHDALTVSTRRKRRILLSQARALRLITRIPGVQVFLEATILVAISVVAVA